MSIFWGNHFLSFTCIFFLVSLSRSLKLIFNCIYDASDMLVLYWILGAVSDQWKSWCYWWVQLWSWKTAGDVGSFLLMCTQQHTPIFRTWLSEDLAIKLCSMVLILVAGYTVCSPHFLYIYYADKREIMVWLFHESAIAVLGSWARLPQC